MSSLESCPSDESLILGVQAGDDAKLAELMHRWERPIKAFLFRLTGNTDAAEELAQETFVKVYQNSGKFSADKRFAPWVFTIAANLAKNRLRWWKRRPTLSLSAWLEQGMEPADPEDIQQGLLQRERERLRAGLVQKAVAALPLDQRTALVLFEYEGRSMQEIAQVQSCSEKAVENRLYRARCRLRKELSGPLQALES